jgi:hypothetical protein
MYSPELDYKRQLGHRVLPREDFRRLLKKYRGSFYRDKQGLDIGCTVEIYGLVSRPELNGSHGRIRATPSASDRYLVELYDKSMVSLKAANMHRVKVDIAAASTPCFMPLEEADEEVSDNLIHHVQS